MEEAVETKPFSVESPLTASVLEADSAPVTFRLEVKVEEAVASSPPFESMEKSVVEAEERIWKGMPVWFFCSLSVSTSETEDEIGRAHV